MTAVNGDGESGYSNQVSATPEAPPAAPTNLTATAGNAVVSLSWSASTGATWYVVLRSTTSGSGYTVISSDLSSTSYSDTTVTNGTTYYYVVLAEDSFGESGYSNQASATPEPPPSPPTGLTATAGNALVLLSWTASTGATSYNVYRSTTSGSGYSQIANGLTSTSYTDTGVTNGTTYYYVVTAVNSSGESGYSNEASATPEPAPSPPTSLTATAGNAQVSLSWVSGAGSGSYNVYRSLTSGGPYSEIASAVAATSYTDSSVSNGTTYYYVVAGVNQYGTGGYSNEASATPEAPPAAPSNLTASPGDTQVSLSWMASAGATSYNVYWSLTSGSHYRLAASGVTTTSYTDTGLSDGVEYFFVVAAVNESGRSAFSNEASATPDPPAPPAPTNLIASAVNSQVSLTWTASANADNYTVLRSATSGSGYVSVASGLTSTSYTDNQVENGTTYYYVVTASNLGGTSGYSNQASATPSAAGLGPQPPTNLTAVGGNTQVYLTWNASVGATIYSVYRSTTNGSGYQYLAETAGTSYVDGTVWNSGTFYYVVTASNQYGTSGYSNQASATASQANSEYLDGFLVTWSGGSYSGGTSDDIPWYLYMPYGNYESLVYTSYEDQSASISGPVTASFSWVDTAAPPPDALLVTLFGYAISECDLATSYANDGLGNAEVPIVYDGQTLGYDSSGYASFPEGNGTVDNFSLSASPSTSGTWGGDNYQIASLAVANIGTITMSFLGATAVGTGQNVVWNIAPGQQLNASLVLQGLTAGPGDTYQWSVQVDDSSASGPAFKDYLVGGSYSFQVPLSSSDFTKSNVKCYFPSDAKPYTATIQCTYYNANSLQTFTVGPKVLNVLPPSVSTAAQASAQSLVFAYTTGEPPNETITMTATRPNHLIYWNAKLGDNTAGVLHQDIVTDSSNIAPQGQSGKWGYAQLVQGYTTAETTSHYGTWTLGPLSFLDGNPVLGAFPGLFPWVTRQGTGWVPSGQAQLFTDSPGDLIGPGTANFTFSSAFSTYLYYQPPSNGIYIPVGEFNWSIPTWTGVAPTSPGGSWTSSGSAPSPPGNLALSVPFPAWLAPPMNLSAALSGGGSSVQLSWTAPPEVSVLSGADGTVACTYTVWRSAASGGSYSQIATGQTGVTYTDTAAPSGTNYYVVTVTCTDSASGASATSEYSNEAASQAPGAPTNFQASLGFGLLTFSWNPVQNAEDYQILYGSSSGGPYPNIITIYGQTTSATVPLKDTVPGSYYLVVEAYWDQQYGQASNQITVTVLPQPTGLAAVGGNAQVSLNWTASTGATGYTVYRSSTSDSGFVAVGAPTTNSYVDTNVTNGRTYYYEVVATCNNGESPPSTTTNGTPGL